MVRDMEDVYGSRESKARWFGTAVGPHEHRWQAAGVVYYDDPNEKRKRWRSWAIAQSCECGEVRTRKLYEPDR